MQEQVKKPYPKEQEDTPAPAAPSPEFQETADALKDGLDDILDEIDAVLETNAEEFVNSYIQKGGE